MAAPVVASAALAWAFRFHATWRRRMGGAISVESEPGRGSCLHPGTAGRWRPGRGRPPLPPRAGEDRAELDTRRTACACPADASRTRMPTASPTERGGRPAWASRPGRLILAVEDDVDFARALVALAHDLDFDCVVAPTAEQALALAAELRPSGILLDIGLPDVSGLSVLERLKRDPATRHIPVHVVSAVERTQVALELGAVGFLIKPATRERPGQRDRATGTDQRTRRAPAADRRGRPGAAREPAVAAGPRPTGDRRGRHHCRGDRAAGRRHLSTAWSPTWRCPTAAATTCSNAWPAMTPSPSRR